MTNSRIIAISFAVIVLFIIGIVALVVTGTFEAETVDANVSWSVSARNPISYHQVDLDGDGVRDIFVEDDSGFHVLNDDGSLRFSQPVAAPFAAAVMRVDDDDSFEIVLYQADADVVILDGGGGEIRRFSAADVVSGAGRMRIAGPEQDEIVLADQSTRLAAFSAGGELLWSANAASGQLRALVRLPDDLGGQVVVGSEAGRVAIFDAAGRELWAADTGDELRRLRAFAVNGTGQVFAGGVDGRLNVYDALSGDLRWSANLGQSVDEIRAVELDGDPATTEIAIGGRDGGVWYYNAAGDERWSRRVAGKVNEIASLNTAAYGDLLAIGDETGSVTLFRADGNQLSEVNFGSEITLLQNDRLLGNDTLLIGGASQVQLWQPQIITRTNYTIPLAVTGLVIVLVVAAAIVINRMTLVAAEESARSKRLRVLARSEEELLTRWRVLREKSRDLDDARGNGTVTGETYLERLRDLRDEMALVSGGLEKRGVKLEIKVIQCPTCGAPVDTRNDNCEFCGATLTQYG